MIDKISNDEIRNDIRETELEIEAMIREEKGLRIIGDRWSVMRADSRLDGIEERKLFIEKLKGILRARGDSYE